MWRDVTREEAEKHPLYGIGGWLLIYLVLTVLGLVLAVLGVAMAPTQTDLIVNGIGLVLYLLVLVLAVMKAKVFPLIALILLWISLVASVLIAVAFLVADPVMMLAQIAAGSPELDEMLPPSGTAEFAGFAEAMKWGVLAVCAVLGLITVLYILYFAGGRRVNVTYRLRVREGDPYAP